MSKRERPEEFVFDLTNCIGPDRSKDAALGLEPSAASSSDLKRCVPVQRLRSLEDAEIFSFAPIVPITERDTADERASTPDPSQMLSDDALALFAIMDAPQLPMDAPQLPMDALPEHEHSLFSSVRGNHAGVLSECGGVRGWSQMRSC